MPRGRTLEEDVSSGWRVQVGLVAVCAVLGWLPARAAAQDAAALPEAPAEQQSSVQKPDANGSISGTVVDSDGEAIAGALVTLTGNGLSGEKKAIADGEGYFSFIGLPPGNFKLTVSAKGFATAAKPLTLHAAEQMSTPDIALPVASETADVEVSFTQHDLAEEQMHIEETQRLGGLIPNFYVTYDWHAAPMSAGQKYKLAWRATWDPANFVVAGIIAGAEQATNSYSGYGQGAQGYAKRYAASVGDFTIGNFLGGAVFPALLHQDPRYFYKGTGSFISRVLYAVGTAFYCRGDNGKWQPNYSSVLADVASGAISNLYYPESDRNGAVVTIEHGLLNALGDGISNLLEEFVFKHITPGAPKGGGQP
jgi:hypothetical protein